MRKKPLNFGGPSKTPPSGALSRASHVCRMFNHTLSMVSYIVCAVGRRWRLAVRSSRWSVRVRRVSRLLWLCSLSAVRSVRCRFPTCRGEITRSRRSTPWISRCSPWTHGTDTASSHRVTIHHIGRHQLQTSTISDLRAPKS